MTDTAFLVVAALAFGAALVKVGSMLGPRRQPGQGLLLVLLVTLAFSCFALSDKVQYQEDRVYHDLGRLLSNLSAMAAGFAVLALPVTLSRPLADARRRIRRYLPALAGCAGGMASCFAAASPLPETGGDFGALYAARPELLAYIVLFLAFLGTALGELLLVSARYARLARQHPWLRAGLLLMSTGAVLGLAYLGEKAVYVFTQAARLPPPFAGNQGCHSLLAPPQCVFTVTLPVAYVLLTATGATLPVWGAALAGLIRYCRNWLAFRALRPLHAAICEAFPEVELGQPAGGPRWDLSFRLYRRVIEIDDGRLLLRPYMSTAVTGAAGSAGRASGLRGTTCAPRPKPRGSPPRSLPGGPAPPLGKGHRLSQSPNGPMTPRVRRRGSPRSPGPTPPPPQSAASSARRRARALTLSGPSDTIILSHWRLCACSTPRSTPTPTPCTTSSARPAPS